MEHGAKNKQKKLVETPMIGRTPNKYRSATPLKGRLPTPLVAQLIAGLKVFQQLDEQTCVQFEKIDTTVISINNKFHVMSESTKSYLYSLNWYECGIEKWQHSDYREYSAINVDEKDDITAQLFGR